MDRVEAIRLGELAGVEDVMTVLNEQGRETVLATLRAGHDSWSESAAAAGCHTFDGVPADLKGAYYEAYDRAAQRRAEEIRDEAA